MKRLETRLYVDINGILQSHEVMVDAMINEKYNFSDLSQKNPSPEECGYRFSSLMLEYRYHKEDIKKEMMKERPSDKRYNLARKLILESGLSSAENLLFEKYLNIVHERKRLPTSFMDFFHLLALSFKIG